MKRVKSRIWILWAKRVKSRIWILWAIGIIIVGCSNVVLIKITTDYIIIPVNFILILALSIFLPIIARQLADNGWFWVRVPERFGVFIMKDKNLQRILMAVTDKVKLGELQKVAQDTGNGQLFEFVPDGQLIWVGLPWLGYELHSWYENSKDEIDPEMDPHYILDLMERTWDYSAEEMNEEEKESFVNEWGVDTADPIQVIPKMSAVVEVVNPQKAVFSVTYFHEAVRREILKAWKDAAQEFHYFIYKTEENKNGNDKFAIGKERLHLQVQDKFNELFGFSKEESKIPDEPTEYPEEKPARMIYDIYGIWVKHVLIRDVDPVEEEMRKNLQKKFTAQTEAAANIEKAKGDKVAKIQRADGEVYEIRETGKARAGASQAMFEAKAAGLKKISENLGLNEEDNKLLFLAEQTIEMAKESDYTYFSGEGGQIGPMAMGFADRLARSIDKIRTGSTKEAKVGFKEIKEAWDKLTDEQRVELSKLTEKGKDGKK